MSSRRSTDRGQKRGHPERAGGDDGALVIFHTDWRVLSFQNPGMEIPLVPGGLFQCSAIEPSCRPGREVKMAASASPGGAPTTLAPLQVGGGRTVTRGWSQGGIWPSSFHHDPALHLPLLRVLGPSPGQAGWLGEEEEEEEEGHPAASSRWAAGLVGGSAPAHVSPGSG